jgi:hypothetical protein
MSSPQKNFFKKIFKKILFCTSWSIISSVLQYLYFRRVTQASGLRKYKKNLKLFENVVFGGSFLDRKVFFSWNPEETSKF